MSENNSKFININVPDVVRLLRADKKQLMIWGAV